ncbi:hypothetical protein A3J90_03405 [candidate division WOR-1 bacterium RIFOXYC2_FULL_37_10]|uniref:DUF1015 domain-containing protein n=1 Tax=candidate division WOR-1 bacterium RIFOXYB2_FULL_37_13 TaxID=1802579 RepID=A0A1F4SVN4_UNCSA|nr:MAG: hypothetical protein A2246_01045 [candidate division WOR-1 bacterium RIFOXYA2_FULL_37_7]OGC24417.1 MAG: hypothetical protein A2310_08410 [candidate division WOR-1 bacterium RIFOXYB2_FULL_37_13]OGC37487.1 MAG: hypothetical protein A3J90_03405 [candidate division WOR-1 bacterium RIFOXYC2_FULL_37_10]
MVNIFPFRGVVYNKKKVKKLSKVISPPYDVISSEEQDDLYNLSDFNVIHLIFGKEFPGDNEYNNKYVRAASTFEGWLRHEILVIEEKPYMYVYEQQFKHKGKIYSRKGIIGLLKLEDFGRGKIFPHEYTLSRPKQDRIELIRATSANFDPVFSIFSDDKDKVEKIMKKVVRRNPDFEAKGIDCVINRLWRIKQKGVIKKLQKEFKDKSVFIADGHHRYEAALQFRNEMKLRNTRITEEEPNNYAMMGFVPIQSSGLVVFPIHRIIKIPLQFDLQYILSQLKLYFDVKEFSFGKKTESLARKKLLKKLADMQSKHAFGLYFNEKIDSYYLLVLKDESIMRDIVKNEKPEEWKKLDTTILHTLVFQHILGIQDEDSYIFTHNEEEAIAAVKNGGAPMSVLLNPINIENIVKIAQKFERMPQKSTYFYPKLTTGMVMNKLIYGEKIE